MTRFWRLGMMILVLFMMGARELPRPCIGDGQGNPCAIARCQCTALCSCRSVCGLESSETAETAPACHMHAGAEPTVLPQHVTLPDPPPPMLLASAMRAPVPAPSVGGPAFMPLFHPAPRILPPEPPPRIRVALT
jgi:hypothetical protein